MSIRIMTEVWAGEEKRQSHLLVLLAIADHADDQGVAYPSVGRIAEKSRMSKRQVQRVLRDLVADDRLEIEEGAGPYGTNIFKVVTPCRGDTMTPVTQLCHAPHDTAMSPKSSITIKDTNNKRKGTQADVDRYCEELGLTCSDATHVFNKWEGNGWTNGGKPIRDWKATIRSWKAAGYLPSQKGQKPTAQFQL